MGWLIVLMACWFVGMLILAVFAEDYFADDELGDDPKRIRHIDYLAAQSRKRGL